MPISKNTIEKYLVQIRRIAEHRENNAEKNIRRIYKALLKDLQQFLGVTYANLAEDDKLSYEILSKKQDYARFIEEVEMRINNYVPKAQDEVKKTVDEVYRKSYAGMVNAVDSSHDVAELHEGLSSVRNITPEVVKRAVQNPIHGLTLNETLEKNRKEVIYNIKQQIGIGLTSGDRMSTMAKRIADHVDMSYRKATLITRTEVHRVREQGFHDSAQKISKAINNTDSGLIYTKTWHTMQDNRVRPQVVKKNSSKSSKKVKKKAKAAKARIGAPNHMKMEGVTIPADEQFDLGNGVTADAPGMSGDAGNDCNCRCFLEYDLLTPDEYKEKTGKELQLENDSSIMNHDIATNNFDVSLPGGIKSKLTPGTEIKDIEVFAGKGAKTPLRVKNHLVDNYGGDADNWKHVKGRGYVDVDGESKKAMLHWFEEESVGVVEIFVKGWSKK